MIKKFKYQFVLFFILICGVFLLQIILNRHQDSITKSQETALINMHEETVLRTKTSITVYVTMVSAIRAFFENANEFPAEKQLQMFVGDLISEIGFKDSIVVSWLDTNQVFRYVVTPYEIDPFGLKGLVLENIRTNNQIQILKQLMYTDSVKLLNPINLVEGWAAFPFNFSVKNSNHDRIGYIACVLDVKYLLRNPKKEQQNYPFFNTFIIGDTINITSEAVFDGSKIYNTSRDPDSYKNYIKQDTRFIYSTLNFHGLTLKIGTAYKEEPKTSHTLALLMYTWYALLCLFIAMSFNQFIRNSILSKRIKIAHSQIANKNSLLEKNMDATKILLKEIHHRVKNNMQIMSSLMNLQSNNTGHEETKSVLKESKGRIQSMALIHQKLYGNGNFTDVNVKEYLDQLISYVEHTLEDNTKMPQKHIKISNSLLLNMNTMAPLGLMLNEMLTNSYKYAFNESEMNWIKIEIEAEADSFKLIYSDSGPGIPSHISPAKSGTLGLELIYILAEQLDGVVRYDKSPESTFLIHFNKTEA